MEGRETPFWRRYLRFWGANPRADIEDELSFHLEARVQELMARGATETEARADARRAFGDVLRVREQLEQLSDRHSRVIRRTAWIGDLRADLKLGIRLLLRRPQFAVAVIATLALGIAASTTIFGLVRGVLLRPLPYPRGDRLVVLWEHNVPRGRTENVVSVPNLEAWRQRTSSYIGLAGLVPESLTVLGDTPDRLYGGAVSPEWFEVVGVAPRLGRAFTAEDARTGSVIVLSHELWVRRYGSDPGIVGGKILLDGESYHVLGVMPRGFDAPTFGWLESQEFWVPFLPDADNRTWGRFLLVLGRLRDGIDLAGAQTELTAIAADRARSDPRNRDWTADVVPLLDQITGDLATPLLVLLGAVALLHLMAVVNVTSLVLARVQDRDLEFSVRVALGAGRRRVLRQLLAEALVLVSLGALLGLVLAAGITRALTPLLPQDFPRLDSIRVDAGVLSFGAGLALVTFVILGLLPIGALLRSALETRLRQSSARLARSRASSAIMVVEIAMAVTLTVAAGLAMRSFVELRSTRLGFVPEGVISMRIALGPGYASDESRRLYYERVIEQLRRVPGVESVGAGHGRILSSGNPRTAVQLADRKVDLPPSATIQVVTADYFTTMRTRLLDGRAHSADDRAGTPFAFVINRSLARSLLPGAGSVGRRIVVALSDGMQGEVVGVVDDVRFGALADEPAPMVYIAHAQWPEGRMHVLVRSSTPLALQASALRTAIWSVDRNIPIQQLETLEDVLSQATAQDRINMLILGLFSIIALVLAGTGIYGVLALEVGRRRRELGIRLSMGAEPAALQRLVLGRALSTAALGIGSGCVLALAATRSMQAMLFGVAASDTRTYVAVAAVLLLTALLAAFVPARRATRVDPLTALRAE